MKHAVRLWVTGLLVPAVSVAQERAVAEVGTNLGITIQDSGGPSLTHFGIPGEGILGQPTIYVSFFPGDALLAEPQVTMNILFSDGNTATTVGLAGFLGYLFSGPEVSSGYLGGMLAFQSVSGGRSSVSEIGMGGKVGYRIVAAPGLAVRIEGGFRRWPDADLNEISVGVAVGGVVRRP